MEKTREKPTYQEATINPDTVFVKCECGFSTTLVDYARLHFMLESCRPTELHNRIFAQRRVAIGAEVDWLRSRIALLELEAHQLRSVESLAELPVRQPPVRPRNCRVCGKPTVGRLDGRPQCEDKHVRETALDLLLGNL